MVGLSRADDAGVYRISGELALIQTVDFFTPVVDDPFVFGRIAAANALSDVYAMGGQPKIAMNLVAFPSGAMDYTVLRRILEGGLHAIAEADAVLAGGHSVRDPELKYGLSVTGFVHPDRIWLKSGLHPGDALILTKAIGTGIAAKVVKARMAPPGMAEEAERRMISLNRVPAEILMGFPVTACTDITGFGLLGHIAEMLSPGIGVRIFADRVPLIPGILEFARMGLLPAGAHHNRDFRAALIRVKDGVDPILSSVFFDPQTSGGLLVSLGADRADEAVSALHDAGVTDAVIIGEVVAEDGITVV